MAALPIPAAERPLAFAIRHINASARDPIDAPTLLDALTAETVPAVYEHHVRTLLDEVGVEVETIGDLVRSGAVTYPVLARGAWRCLPPGHETRQWLDERAMRRAGGRSWISRCRPSTMSSEPRPTRRSPLLGRSAAAPPSRSGSITASATTWTSSFRRFR